MSSKNFIAIFFAIIAVFIVVSTTTFFINYNFLLNKKKIQSQNNANKIAAIINENFEYSEKLLSFIGQRISTHNKAQDLDFIYQTFVSIAQIEGTNNLFSWSRFDWVDRNNLQTVNTMTGISREHPQDMSIRGYTKEAKIEPWKLKFVAPLYGFPSSVYVIPVGVGVTSENGGYMGVVVAGINISKLSNKISDALEYGEHFVIIDSSDNNNLRAIFGSNKIENDVDFANFDWAKKSYSTDNRNFLEQEIAFKDVHYIYSTNANKNYPYTILTGYDEKKFWREFYVIFMPILVNLIFITAVAEIFLFVRFRYKI